MVRNFKRKTERGSALPDVKLSAVWQVKLKGKSIRSAAEDFGVNYPTLIRYCKKLTTEDIEGRHQTPSLPVG